MLQLYLKIAYEQSLTEIVDVVVVDEATEVEIRHSAADWRTAAAGGSRTAQVAQETMRILRMINFKIL